MKNIFKIFAVSLLCFVGCCFSTQFRVSSEDNINTKNNVSFWKEKVNKDLAKNSDLEICDIYEFSVYVNKDPNRTKVNLFCNTKKNNKIIVVYKYNIVGFKFESVIKGK